MNLVSFYVFNHQQHCLFNGEYDVQNTLKAMSLLDLQLAKEISQNTNLFNISNRFNTTTRKVKPRKSALEVRPGQWQAKKRTKECSGAECRGGGACVQRAKGSRGEVWPRFTGWDMDHRGQNRAGSTGKNSMQVRNHEMHCSIFKLPKLKKQV